MLVECKKGVYYVNRPFYPSLLFVVSNARLFAAAFCLQQERRVIFGKDTQNVWRGNKYWSVPFRIGKHYNAIFIAIDHLGRILVNWQ